MCDRVEPINGWAFFYFGGNCCLQVFFGAPNKCKYMICCSTTRGVFTMTRVFLHQEFCIPIFKVSQGLIFGAYQFRNCSPQNNMSISLKKNDRFEGASTHQQHHVLVRFLKLSLDLQDHPWMVKLRSTKKFRESLVSRWSYHSVDLKNEKKKQVPNIEKNQALQTCLHFYDLLMFPKIVGFLPKTCIWRGFSIIFTIHFGGPPLFFGNTHLLMVIYHRE